MTITDEMVERAAEAIKFIVPISDGSRWTDKGRTTTAWPEDFSQQERNTVRAIARAALSTLPAAAPHGVGEGCDGVGWPSDLVDIISSMTNYIQNERVRCFNEGVDAERAHPIAPPAPASGREWAKHPDEDVQFQRTHALALERQKGWCEGFRQGRGALASKESKP